VRVAEQCPLAEAAAGEVEKTVLRERVFS